MRMVDFVPPCTISLGKKGPSISKPIPQLYRDPKLSGPLLLPWDNLAQLGEQEAN